MRQPDQMCVRPLRSTVALVFLRCMIHNLQSSCSIKKHISCMHTKSGLYLHSILQVSGLNLTDASTILKHELSRNSRTLTQEQTNTLMDAFEKCSHVLFVKVKLPVLNKERQLQFPQSCGVSLMPKSLSLGATRGHGTSSIFITLLQLDFVQNTTSKLRVLEEFLRFMCVK